MSHHLPPFVDTGPPKNRTGTIARQKAAPYTTEKSSRSVRRTISLETLHATSTTNLTNRTTTIPSPQQPATASNDDMETSTSPPPEISLQFSNMDSKFYNSKFLLTTILKYLPRADITRIILSKNGVILKSTNPDLRNTILNKIGFTTFGQNTQVRTLSPLSPLKSPLPPRTSPMFSAVIRGIDPSLTDDEILTELQAEGFNIKRAIRIKNASGPTYMIRILTDCRDTIDQALQSGVYIYKQRYRTEPSRSPPPIALRCDRCQSYNLHSTDKCPNNPVCSHCRGAHTISKCDQLAAKPICNTCSSDHPTYSYKCKEKPEPIPNHPPSVAPVITKDPITFPTNSHFQPVTTEALLRFITLTLQNIHPYERPFILSQIERAAHMVFQATMRTTYSGLHAHFQFERRETLV